MVVEGLLCARCPTCLGKLRLGLRELRQLIQSHRTSVRELHSLTHECYYFPREGEGGKEKEGDSEGRDRPRSPAAPAPSASWGGPSQLSTTVLALGVGPSTQ